VRRYESVTIGDIAILTGYGTMKLKQGIDYRQIPLLGVMAAILKKVIH